MQHAIAYAQDRWGDRQHLLDVYGWAVKVFIAAYLASKAALDTLTRNTAHAPAQSHSRQRAADGV